MPLIRFLPSSGSNVFLTCCFLLTTAFSFPGKPKPGTHVIAFKKPGQLKEFFKYTPDRIPFISAHRGGPKVGLPENCIATFENTLQHTWSLIELDPHYTKDSALVLMHDATLDRTSTGKGKVSNYTLAEIRNMRLKDTEGNVTAEVIPTLDEIIEWSKGKTIILIDQKDVSAEARAQKIREHHAQASAMVMVYSLADAKKCYAIDKDIMMELVFVSDIKGAEEFDKSGVPWENVVVFVTHTEPKEKALFKYVHDKGAMCIRGSSKTIDKEVLDAKGNGMDLLNKKYQQLILDGADIIEADLGIEAGLAIKNMQEVKSGKRKYFKMAD